MPSRPARRRSDAAVPPAPTLGPATGFAEASDAVIDYLKQAVPMGHWAVTRYDGVNQVRLSVRDDRYGTEVGTATPWSGSFCQYATSGRAPTIAPDVDLVPLYADIRTAAGIEIGSYVGMPITTGGGELFGTLCGYDPDRAPDLAGHGPLLGLLSGLLGVILEADQVRADQERRLEQAALVAETDELTGLVNRRGWVRFMALEEARYRRFGTPGAVVILDLDGLKEVNDTLGHGAGDDYLRTAAVTLSSNLREGDVLARLGGDEFGLLVAEQTPGQALGLCRRLRQALDVAGVPTSIGQAPYSFVAGFPGAWEEADRAMYEDKRRRRGVPAGATPVPTAQGAA